MIAIFITVLIDMLSFGLVIPDIQIRAPRLGGEGWVLGALIASFSFAQFVVAPFAGRLSDRVGRKPILIAGALLNVVGFVFYAHATSLAILFASRIISGIGSSNIASAYAYAADHSDPEHRAKSLGFLGAAFGLGFVLGPPAGGLLVNYGGLLILGYGSAIVALLNVFWVQFFVFDRKREEVPHTTSRRFSFELLRRTLALPGIPVLLMLFFAFNLAMANLYGTFVTFSHDLLGFDQLDAGLFLGSVGLQTAFYQGVLIGPLTKRFGEANLARTGLLLVGPALALIPFVPTAPWLYAGSFPLCFGVAMSAPTIQSLISRAAPATIQGGVFGITQSLGSLARIAGPIMGQSMYFYWFRLPYFIAGGLALIAALIAWTLLPRRPAPVLITGSSPEP